MRSSDDCSISVLPHRFAEEIAGIVEIFIGSLFLKGLCSLWSSKSSMAILRSFSWKFNVVESPLLLPRFCNEFLLFLWKLDVLACEDFVLLSVTFDNEAQLSTYSDFFGLVKLCLIRLVLLHHSGFGSFYWLFLPWLSYDDFLFCDFFYNSETCFSFRRTNWISSSY